ncbi:MAG: hypothetical protein AB7T49_17180 [Oligoflexales bacterium]
MKLMLTAIAALFLAACSYKAENSITSSQIESSTQCETALDSGATLSMNLSHEQLTILQRVPRHTLVAPIRVGVEPASPDAYPAGKNDFYCETRSLMGFKVAFDVTQGFLKVSEYPVLGTPRHRYYRFR